MTFSEHLEWVDSWPPNAEDYNYFVTSASSHCNWQQPGLAFGSGKSTLLNSMVGAEPLYTMERYAEYHKLQKENFHADFARRLRCYLIDEIALLPKDSFSIIAVYNQFPFLPWNKVSTYLEHLAQSLSPGGYIYFNYNNCRYPKSFRYFEIRAMPYTTPEMYIELCQKLGLEFVHNSIYISGLVS